MGQFLAAVRGQLQVRDRDVGRPVLHRSGVASAGQSRFPGGQVMGVTVFF
ncbi:MAG: hypothetical protein ACYC6Y_18470 [Thermoguttaceae bacterium]